MHQDQAQPGIIQSNLLTSDDSYPAVATYNYWEPLAEPADTSHDTSDAETTHIHKSNHTRPKKVSWKDQVRKQCQEGGKFHYFSTVRFKELKAKRKRERAKNKVAPLPVDSKQTSTEEVKHIRPEQGSDGQKTTPVSILKPTSYDAKSTKRRSKRERYEPRAVPKRPPTSSPLSRFRDNILAKVSGAVNVAARMAKAIAPTGILDSGASGHFGPENGGLEPTGETSDKVVGLADGAPVRATGKAKLPMKNLRETARDGDIIPGLKNTLVSVSKLSDDGYVTIFQPGGQGVEVYDQRDVRIVVTGEAALRGWRDPHS